MEITEVKPINPFNGNVKPNLSEIPLQQTKVPKDLLDEVNVPADISWLEYQRFKLGIYIKLVPNIFFIIKGITMKNWKTTLSGILGGVAVMLKVFGVEVPPDVLNGVIAIAMFFIGLFAHDASATEKVS